MKASGQVVRGSERLGNVVVLPKVWAVGEKKPVGSVGSVGGALRGGAASGGPVALPVEVSAGTRNAGISPLRCASVEMTGGNVGMSSVRPVALPVKDLSGRRNTGVSPLRRYATPVEMTNSWEGVRAPVVEAGSLRANNQTEVAFYRKYTEAMLRRYAVMSMEAGRVPSMLGREMFRGKVTSYQMHGFDDVVNFCLDVESCLRRLSREEQFLVKRVAVQQYTHGEAALMLGVCLRTGITRYYEALDRLTRVFLEVKLLDSQKACQEVQRPLLRVSRSSEVG